LQLQAQEQSAVAVAGHNRRWNSRQLQAGNRRSTSRQLQLQTAKLWLLQKTPQRAGTERAQPPHMNRKSVENLKVYQRAVAGADEIFAITEKPIFDRDTELRQQLRTSSGRIQAHLQEGSAQSTDKHKAHYVAIALGSAKEVKGHLRRALGYGFITQDEYAKHWNVYDEIAAMLSGLKNYLDPND
jgi:four helix bundle protein